MVRFLFDVSLLIAILDPDHALHAVGLSWFNDEGHRAWATSPIVQNGVVRILGAAKYTAMPFGCDEVTSILTEWCAVPEHEFWADDISLLDTRLVDASRLTSPGRVTDTYLLALAASRGGKFATLDKRVSTDAVIGGDAALHIISSPSR